MTANTYIESRRIAEEYQDREFPVKYHQLVCGILDPRMLEEDKIILKSILEILSGMKKGDRMLDFGCGPTIHRIASASRYYKEIICADYSDYNRKEIEKWLKKDSQCLDWTPVLDNVALLEGYDDLRKGTKEIEERIRSSIKNVIRCDILADPPISKEYGKFDVLLTAYCIEAACTTIEQFEDAVKKICDLIKNDGSLIMMAVLDSTSYLAHKDLHILKIDGKLIKNSLEECGMKIKTWKFIENDNPECSCKHSGVVILSADRNVS